MPKAIVLAGGGARGSYHIGAWQALNELGYIPDIVTGTSVGSMNATLLALDRFEDAKAMWLSLNGKDVLTMPSEISTREILKFVKKFAIDGGLDISPMEMMITRFLDEDELRKARCKYGLVTVNLNTLKPMELTLDDIPRGELIDYVMASGACFPALKMKDIKGQKFIDGGYFDNVPNNLAAKMGATEIVEVDLDGVGNTRRLYKKHKGIKLTRVKSYHDLGSILAFNPELAQRNIDLGYLDTYKAFGKLDGVAYAFKKGELDNMHAIFGQELLRLCGIITSIHPTIALRFQVLFTHDKTRGVVSGDIDKFLAVLEHAMLCANAPLGEIYTQQSVVSIIMQAKPSALANKYDQLLEDNVASRLLAPIAVANFDTVLLSLIQLLINPCQN